MSYNTLNNFSFVSTSLMMFIVAKKGIVNIQCCKLPIGVKKTDEAPSNGGQSKSSRHVHK